MTGLPDTNVVLNAINPTAEHHAACRDWLSAQCARGIPIGWSWRVLVGFVRLATTKNVFAKPLTGAEAMDYIDQWLLLPNARVLQPGPTHRTLLRGLVEKGATGNLAPDAHLAALAIEHGAELCSCDSDFGRFPGLRWFNPATGSRTRP